MREFRQFISSPLEADIGVQYRVGDHTFTFARKVHPCQALSSCLFVEIDGAVPKGGDVIPSPLAEFLTRNKSDHVASRV